MRKIATALIKIYKFFISNQLVYLFGHGCRFNPTCSEYSVQMISKHGIVKGGNLSLKRIIRCNPWI